MSAVKVKALRCMVKWCLGFYFTSIFFMFSIANVAVRKRHQRQDENLIFLPALYWNQQNCFSASNAHIYNQRKLCETRVSIASEQAYAV